MIWLTKTQPVEVVPPSLGGIGYGLSKVETAIATHLRKLPLRHLESIEHVHDFVDAVAQEG